LEEEKVEINLEKLNINLSENIEVERLRHLEGKLRLKERAIGEQLRKLQELQTQVIKKRQSLTAKRDAMERELFERAGKVQYLRSRKTPQKQGQAVPRETKWERAIRLVSEGKLEEAKALVGK